MYTKYHTEGIILEWHDRNEADRVYRIFTKDLGMIYARAVGVRREGAKLQGALHLFSYIDLSCIRARDVWKITDARVVVPTYHTLQKNPQNRAAILRLGQLMKMLVRGEEHHEALFAVLREGIHHFINEREDGDSAPIEALLALRMLERLGHLPRSRHVAHLIASPFITPGVVAETYRLRDRIVATVNDSMRQLSW